MPEKAPYKPLLAYATRVKIETDAQRQWIELHFNDYPHPMLKLKLLALGFQTRKVSLIFRAEFSGARQNYGLELERSLLTMPEGPELLLEPSFQPLQASIEKKQFSLVKLGLADGSIKSYVLFESSRYKAELIATVFARRTFGEQVRTVGLFPGKKVKEAALLFAEGKVILPHSEAESEVLQEDASMETPKLEPYEIRDAYYNSISGNEPDNLRYSSIKRNDFDSWVHQNYPELSDEFIEKAWGYHQARVSAEKTVERLSKKHAVQPYTAIYNKLLKVIPDLVFHLRAGTENGTSKLNSSGMMDLSYDFLSSEDDDSFVIALAHRFEQNGDLVDDPDMQIRVMPKQKIAEALTIQDQFGYKQVYFKKEGKNYVYAKIKKDLNAFLNQWLSNILEQGHRIILTENPRTPAEEKKDSEADESSIFKQAYQLLKQVIPAFPHHSLETMVETLQGEDHKLEVTISPNSSDSMNLDITQHDADGQQIEVQYEGLIYTEKEEIHMSFELLDNYYQSHFDRDESEEEIDARGADVGEVLTGAFNKFLRELIRERVVVELKSKGRTDVVSSLISTPPLTDYQETKFITPAKFQSLLPNIIIPAEAKEPFISERFNQGDMNAIIDRDFVHLRALNDRNLAQATALELFYLLQSSHPTDIGLKPSRISVLAECERRGAAFLEELGYPTDPAYPYVNKYVGYHSVEPLGQILGEKGDDWWAAVENYFPLADPEKGLDILRALKVKAIAERDKLVNPKTNKPLAAKLSNYRSLDYDVQSMDKDMAGIVSYLDTRKKKQEAEKIPVFSIYLTTEAHSRQADFSKAGIIHSWKDADAFVRSRLDKHSDVYYKVTWQDQYSIEGMMDIEPSDFFNGKTNLLGNHILTFYTNISRITPGTDPIYGDEKLIREAGRMIERYQFDDQLADDNQNSLVGYGQFPVIIQGLESAYWTEEDNAYPVNKITIKGVDYNQADLRACLLNLLGKLPIERQLQIAEDLATRFEYMRTMEQAEKGFVTIGKRGDARKRAVIRHYVDGIIVMHDIGKHSNVPEVMEYLIPILTKGEDTLMDMPVKVKHKRPARSEEELTPQELNQAIEHFIDEKDQQGDGFSEVDKTYIAGYTGAGGLLKQGAEGRGILYEYYTPDAIVQRMWGLAFRFGYTNGRVLEPSCGTGNFLKYVPAEATVDAYETNHYAKRIAEVLYPFATVQEKSFESIFFAGRVHLKDNFNQPGYELVIGNPPYGEFTGKYAGMGEKKWTAALFYEHYFILRGLDLLIPKGLLVMIIPSSFLENGDKYNPIKEKISKQAELLDAYRLPSRAFKTTDIGTDIVVLRKKI